MPEKSLITITTCNRLPEIKKFVWEYLKFCNENDDFDFLLALDGSDEQYLLFAQIYNIPLLFSEEREGVSLSKNRVLKQFPNYDFYFFIEDDIELLDETIFHDFITIQKITGYSHFCNNHLKTVLKKKIVSGRTISYSFEGGAQFSFFSKQGLKKVGGWHTCFAKYRRFGHTEHSYRFYHSGLQPAPFIYIEEARTKILIHMPPAVTTFKNKTITVNGIVKEEQDFINRKTTFFQLQTISPFFFRSNKFVEKEKLNLVLLKKTRRYPLTKGFERRIALGEHYFLKIKTTNNFLKKIYFFLLSVFYFPFNPPLKHSIKKMIYR